MKNIVRLSKWQIKRSLNSLINFLADRLYPSKEEKVLLVMNVKKIYQCQWASPEAVNASSDPRWKDFGFASKKEYRFWSWRLCAIACLKMILNFFFPKNQLKMSGIVNACLKLGGYDVVNDRGWYHAAIITYLKNNSLKTKQLRFLSFERLKRLIKNKMLVLASINETLKASSHLQDGHIITICGVGFIRGKKFIYYLDPGDPQPFFSGKPSVMSWNNFLKRYLLRAIAVSYEKR